MVSPKRGKTKAGRPMHYVVGAVLEHDGKFLLIDRVYTPLGFAGIAGHIDEGETPEQAIIREVKEESDCRVVEQKLIKEEELPWNLCRHGYAHYWHVFRCVIDGKVKRNEKEEKSIGWYTPEEIKQLPLEPVWEYWFRKLQII
ncbi:MAG: NUDIX hydrolase [Nanoarchaeota archaeon]